MIVKFLFFCNLLDYFSLDASTEEWKARSANSLARALVCSIECGTVECGTVIAPHCRMCRVPEKVDTT